MLITFLKGGNEYVACIKACDERSVIIFIKETKKSGRFKNQASFMSTYTSTPDTD